MAVVHPRAMLGFARMKRRTAEGLPVSGTRFGTGPLQCSVDCGA